MVQQNNTVKWYNLHVYIIQHQAQPLTFNKMHIKLKQL